MKIKIFLLISTLILIGFYITAGTGGKLQVVFCNVGEGDASLIRTPNGEDILIDGGPNEAVLNCLGNHLPFYDRDIELAILSHPQSDHLTGLIEVFKRYNVKNLLISSLDYDSQLTRLSKKIIAERKISLIKGSRGQIISLDGVQVKVLWPNYCHQAEIYCGTTHINDNSLVVEVDFGNFNTLYTGDISQKILNQLSDIADLEIIKIPHHGSKTSLSQKFFTMVRPSLAVISVGKNSYGHPSSEVLNLLEKLGIKTLRTDSDGEIEIESDGKGYEIKNRR